MQYASRSLTDTEKRCSQIKLEALADDFGCKRFRQFLYGRPLQIVTDHKPLESVFSTPTHLTSIRVHGIVNRMLDYDFVVEYRPGKENISDYTSRHPMPFQTCINFEPRTTKEVRRYVNYVVTCNTPNAVTKEPVQKATDEDPTLPLRGCIRQGWIDAKAANVQAHKYVFSERAIVDVIVVRGDRSKRDSSNRRQNCRTRNTQTEDDRNSARGASRTSTDETAAGGTRLVPGNGLPVQTVSIHLHLLAIRHTSHTSRTPENDGATRGAVEKSQCGLLRTAG